MRLRMTVLTHNAPNLNATKVEDARPRMLETTYLNTNMRPIWITYCLECHDDFTTRPQLAIFFGFRILKAPQQYRGYIYTYNLK